MMRAIGTRFGPHRLAVAAVALVILAGCEEGLNLGSGTVNDASDVTTDNDQSKELFPETASGAQRDVEAPDVFQVTEAGLWDGRPSLGGIWIAHPDVTQPERVLIKNTSNNKSITGALFRRDRNLPGPALQVSSAAASKLGMLAGAPTRLEVVALRRETIEQPPAPPADSETPADAESDAATEVAEGTEAAAEEKPVKRKWWQKKPAETAAVTGAATGAAVATTSDDADQPDDAPTPEAQTEATAEAAPAAEEKPAKRKWWQKKPADETAVDAGAAAVAGASVATEATQTENTQTASLSDPEVTPPVEKPKKKKWWQKKDPNEITETPLDPIAGAAAAIEAAEPEAEAASSTAVSSLAKPYVQVGTFGVEANAKTAADKIRRNGLPAELRELKTEDKTVWRVLVGPAQNRNERKATLGDVKDLGFTDAFIAKN